MTESDPGALIFPDQQPSLWSPLTPLVLATRATAHLGLMLPAARTLGALAHRAVFLRRGFRGYRARPGDVIVSTFPKSGTNWAMQIGQQIAWRGAAEFRHIHCVVPWPDAPSERVLSLDAVAPPSPTGHRIIKTHLGADGTPWDSSTLCVAVIRDPKEVVVSAYHFVMGLLGLLDRVSPEDFVEIFLADAMPWGGWATHAAGWWALRERDNVQVLEFGAMKRDLPGHVDRLAAAMGVELSASERAAVLERSGLPWMKAHDAQFTPVPLPTVRPKERVPMIRRGASGGSGEMLDAAQQGRIDAHCRQGLLDLGCDLPYDAWFGPRG